MTMMYQEGRALCTFKYPVELLIIPQGLGKISQLVPEDQQMNGFKTVDRGSLCGEKRDNIKTDHDVIWLESEVVDESGELV